MGWNHQPEMILIQHFEEIFESHFFRQFALALCVAIFLAFERDLEKQIKSKPPQPLSVGYQLGWWTNYVNL